MLVDPPRAIQKAFLLIAAAVCQTAPAEGQSTAPKSTAELKRLIVEASTFFEHDNSRRRVSEAKAISDLLTVASEPKTSSILATVGGIERREEAVDWGGPMHDALGALFLLTFTHSNSSPDRVGFDPIVVVNGRIHIPRSGSFLADGRPLRPQYPSFDFNNLSLYKRRDLRPFLAQVLSPKEFAADKRNHGELDQVPAERPTDPLLVSKLLALLEDARASYKGLNGDNRRLVSDLLRVAMTTDDLAIRDAVAKLVERHGLEDRTAAVIDPLREMMWGRSKLDAREDCHLDALAVTNGTLVLTQRYTYLGADNREWADGVGLCSCLWYRRDLTKFMGQAAQLPKATQPTAGPLREVQREHRS